MKIRFYAHASFRLEADGLAVITDPYTPGPQNSGFDPIDEPADVVIMSSATDRSTPTRATCAAIRPSSTRSSCRRRGRRRGGCISVPFPRWRA